MKSLFYGVFLAALAWRPGISRAETPGCHDIRAKLKYTGSPGLVPEYFFRSLPASGKVTGTFNREHDHQYNQILDIKTGELTPIPGCLDAVASPDGGWLTTPYTHKPHCLIQVGLGFYPVSGLKGADEPLFVDTDLGGFYQSIAVVSKTAKETRYRVAVQTGDKRGNYFIMRDYVDPPRRKASVSQLKAIIESAVSGMTEFWGEKEERARQWVEQQKNDMHDSPEERALRVKGAQEDFEFLQRRIQALHVLLGMLTSAHSRQEIDAFIKSKPKELEEWDMRIKAADYALDDGPPKPLCGNYKPNSLKTAIISKDGTRVAAKVVDQDETVIFNLDPITGDCSPLVNLHRATGKADFSPDGKRVAFHLQKPSEGDESGWLPIPSKTMMSPAYVYDFETGATTEVTQGMTGNFLYPVFFSNGDLARVRFTFPNDQPRADFMVFELTPPNPAACAAVGNPPAGQDEVVPAR
jgi:hypothetical protein